MPPPVRAFPIVPAGTTGWLVAGCKDWLVARTGWLVARPAWKERAACVLLTHSANRVFGHRRS